MPTFVYSTWTDFLEACQRTCERPAHTRASRQTGNREWNGTHSWEECLDLAHGGWPEGVEKTRGIVEQLTQDLYTEVLRPQPKQDVTGQWFDPGLVAEGVPECCYEWTEIRQSGPAVKIVVNGCVSGGVSAETITNRGAAVCAFVQALELAGRQSEIWLGINSKGYDLQVCIKQADAPAQLDQLAFALAHPSVLRRLAFSHWEIDGMPEAHVGSGYGRVMDTEISGADIVLESAHLSVWRDDQTCKRHVEDWLRRYHYVEAVA